MISCNMLHLFWPDGSGPTQQSTDLQPRPRSESCCFQEDDDIPSESSATKQALVAGSLVLVLEQVFVVARWFPSKLNI